MLRLILHDVLCESHHQVLSPQSPLVHLEVLHGMYSQVCIICVGSEWWARLSMRGYVSRLCYLCTGLRRVGFLKYPYTDISGLWYNVLNHHSLGAFSTCVSVCILVGLHGELCLDSHITHHHI